MKKIKIYWEKLMEMIETDLSAVLFVIVLLCFSASILIRYVFRISIPMVDELSVIAFTWMPLLSSSNGTKTDSHVAFGILYDALGERGKAVMDVAGKTVLLLCLFILLKPAWDTVSFYGIRKTSVFRMPFSWLYMPYMVFLVFTLYRLAVRYIKDIKTLVYCFKKKKRKQVNGDVL